MNATIVSYLAGMGGDFLSYLIHKNPEYYPIEIKQTHHNMWMFPNLLEPVGLEAKIYPSSKPWKITDDDLLVLKNVYKDYKILLPTHWYNNITPELTNNLFSQGIRLYSREEKTLRISYALWWIKSHVIAKHPWELRRAEMIAMIENNHPRAHLIKELLDENNFHNWKFLAIKNNLLKNNKLDLLTYITKHFNFIYRTKNKILTPLKNYIYLPIDNLIYEHSAITDLENLLKVTIDKDSIIMYNEVNTKVLEDNLNIKINGRELLEDKFYSLIKEYAEHVIQTEIDFDDYYNGNFKK